MSVWLANTSPSAKKLFSWYKASLQFFVLEWRESGIFEMIGRRKGKSDRKDEKLAAGKNNDYLPFS
jgi:hypothetical protein